MLLVWYLEHSLKAWIPLAASEGVDRAYYMDECVKHLSQPPSALYSLHQDCAGCVVYTNGDELSQAIADLNF